MPWRKPKRKFDMRNVLPWWKGKIEKDKEGNDVYFKHPYEMVTSINLSNIIDSFTRFNIFLLGIATGGALFIYMAWIFVVEPHPDIQHAIQRHFNAGHLQGQYLMDPPRAPEMDAAPKLAP